MSRNVRGFVVFPYSLTPDKPTTVKVTAIEGGGGENNIISEVEFSFQIEILSSTVGKVEIKNFIGNLELKSHQSTFLNLKSDDVIYGNSINKVTFKEQKDKTNKVVDPFTYKVTTTSNVIFTYN